MANPADGLFMDLLQPARPQQPQPSPADQLFADLMQQQQAKEQVGVIADAGKSFASGFVKGGIGLAALPGTAEQLGRWGINKVAQYAGKEQPVVSPEPGLPSYGDVKTAYESRAGKLYEPKTTLGKYASAVGEFAPGMLFPVSGAAKGIGSQIGKRMTLNVAAPAVVSEAAGQATAGTPYEPWARAGGAIAGGTLPNIVGRMASPGAINTSTAKGAERAKNVGVMQQEGVPLSAGDVSGSKTIRWAESVAQDTPGAAGKAAAFRDNQSEKYVEAVLRKAGIDAKAATPEVMNKAFSRIGAAFENAASSIQVPLARPNQAGRMAFDPIVRRVREVADDYERISQPSLRYDLPRKIADDLQELATRASNMDGKTYLRWRSELGAAARGSQDSASRAALYDIQRALDTSAESFLRRSKFPEMAARADQLRNARREYRNMMAIEKAALGAGEGASLGLFSPQQLAQAVKTAHGSRNYVTGKGDLVDLSHAGASLMAQLPNSGTPARMTMQMIAAAGGQAIAGAPGMAAGAIAPWLAQAMAGRTVMHPTVQRYLSNQAAAPLVSMPQANVYAGRVNAMTQYDDTQDKRKRIARQLAQ